MSVEIFFAEAGTANIANTPATETAAPATTTNQEVPANGQAAQAKPQGFLEGSGFLVVMIILMVAMFYISYRSQKKEKKRLADAISSIRKGDAVVTIGGIHGVVTGVKDNVFTLKIAKDMEIEIQREAVRPAGTAVEAEATATESK